jgi:hypothetical protein
LDQRGQDMTPEIRKLLDDCWHALFHLDTREIARHLPPAEVEEAWQAACVEGERVRLEINKALGEI